MNIMYVIATIGMIQIAQSVLIITLALHVDKRNIKDELNKLYARIKVKH